MLPPLFDVGSRRLLLNVLSVHAPFRSHLYVLHLFNALEAHGISATESTISHCTQNMTSTRQNLQAPRLETLRLALQTRQQSRRTQQRPGDGTKRAHARTMDKPINKDWPMQSLTFLWKIGLVCPPKPACLLSYRRLPAHRAACQQSP